VDQREVLVATPRPAAFTVQNLRFWIAKQ